MFCKLDVRRKSIVTLALSSDSHKIIVRYFVNRAPDSWRRVQAQIFSLETKIETEILSRDFNISGVTLLVVATVICHGLFTADPRMTDVYHTAMLPYSQPTDAGDWLTPSLHRLTRQCCRVASSRALWIGSNVQFTPPDTTKLSSFFRAVNGSEGIKSNGNSLLESWKLQTIKKTKKVNIHFMLRPVSYT